MQGQPEHVFEHHSQPADAAGSVGEDSTERPLWGEPPTRLFEQMFEQAGGSVYLVTNGQ
jgi:hypothetical protein